VAVGSGSGRPANLRDLATQPLLASPASLVVAGLSPPQPGASRDAYATF